MASGGPGSDGAGSFADAGPSASALTFHEFLDRMKQPAAADLVRRIRSFMVAFMGKEAEPDKDGESVQEFYRTTEALFTTHPLWKGASPEELESSGEALEKYLMIKLLPKAFCPEPSEAQRDEQLSLKIAALQHFLQPRHLDIPLHLQNDGSWLLAEKELQKMASFKAPKDKLQCILNSCKIVNNLLLNASISQAAAAPVHSAKGAGDDVKPPGADDFLPVLIYVVVKANPPQLLSNLLFIQRYRCASRLAGEASYFYTNLVSAASFLESLTASQLSIDSAEYERQLAEGYRLAKEQPQMGTIVAGATGEGTGAGAGERESAATGRGGGEPEGASASSGRDRDPVTAAAAPSPGASLAAVHQGTGGGAAGGAPAAPQRLPKEVVVTVEALQRRPEVVAELLRADASGELAKQYRYLYASERDIRLGDVGELLKGYKDLAINERDIRLGDVGELLKGYKDLAIKYYSLCRAVHGAQLVLDTSGPKAQPQPEGAPPSTPPVPSATSSTSDSSVATSAPAVSVPTASAPAASAPTASVPAAPGSASAAPAAEREGGPQGGDEEGRAAAPGSAGTGTEARGEGEGDTAGAAASDSDAAKPGAEEGSAAGSTKASGVQAEAEAAAGAGTGEPESLK